jgi:hypothetical protein
MEHSDIEKIQFCDWLVGSFGSSGANDASGWRRVVWHKDGVLVASQSVSQSVSGGPICQRQKRAPGGGECVRDCIGQEDSSG